MDAIIHEKNPEQISYGHDIISNTSKYLGPKGTVAHNSNGMNCQNCHLEAGTKPWGNNYGAVAATYPKFRERSGTKESIIKRVNDCFERSLNGKALDSSSNEMQAILAYIKYIGQLVPKDTIPKGSGIWKLKFLSRACDPQKGKDSYEQKCISCHQQNGQGIHNPKELDLPTRHFGAKIAIILELDYTEFRDWQAILKPICHWAQLGTMHNLVMKRRGILRHILIPKLAPTKI